MRKQLLSLFLAAWLCILTMAFCSAAEVPADAVAYCQQNGIMGGTSDTTFEPEGTLTRGMLARRIVCSGDLAMESAKGRGGDSRLQ